MCHCAYCAASDDLNWTGPSDWVQILLKSEYLKALAFSCCSCCRLSEHFAFAFAVQVAVHVLHDAIRLEQSYRALQNYYQLTLHACALACLLMTAYAG